MKVKILINFDVFEAVFNVVKLCSWEKRETVKNCIDDTLVEVFIYISLKHTVCAS